MNNQQILTRLAHKIFQEVSRGTDSSLTKVGTFLVARIKEILSTPAPRKTVVSKTGNVTYRAVTPATAGQPPRMLSGKLRSSIGSEITSIAGDKSKKSIAITSNARGVPSSKYPRGFPYPQHHETKDPTRPGSGLHPFVLPAIQKWKKGIASIIGQNIRVGLKQE